MKGPSMAPPTRTALYAGSFDPMTNGHVDVLRRALDIADHVVVAVGINPGKAPLFEAGERAAMIREVAAADDIAAVDRLEVVTFDGLVVEAARTAGANLLVRGLRDGTDFDYEMQLAAMNAVLAPEIRTVFLPASPAVRPITANLVRQVAAMGGDVTAFVPAAVGRRLVARFR
jgi:pantetheine-phosphate adenylyltransferase